MSRLATGGLIDRNKPMGFTFDGAALKGFAGDTLASALLANDVRLFGRSFKYHRPRGVWGAGSEEPNALVELREGQAPRAAHDGLALGDHRDQRLEEVRDVVGH